MGEEERGAGEGYVGVRETGGRCGAGGGVREGGGKVRHAPMLLAVQVGCAGTKEQSGQRTREPCSWLPCPYAAGCLVWQVLLSNGPTGWLSLFWKPRQWVLIRAGGVQ